jgi:serine/threonine-protein kinase
MAEVYLALSRGPNGFNKLVVLKLLRSHLAEDDDFLKMFLAEARLAARLNHANIVQTYEIGVEGGRHAIVMEYLEGRSFAEVEGATKREPMALSLGVRVLADTLAALHHAHELLDVDGRHLGLVHRDVSPHNVFVTYDGQVKLLDFGIAKAADDGARTKTGVFKGKLRYTAPERFAGEESDRRSDIFSVGVMLWQLLTKRRLWAGMNELTVMQQLASRTPVPSPRSVNPEVPERLNEICVKALATSPEDRFKTASEMEDALEEFLAGESVGTTNRALAKYMGEVFGETRQVFQRTVDEQIRAAGNVPLDFEVSGSVARIRADAVPMLGSQTAESQSSIPVPTSSFRVRAGMSLDAASQPPDPSASLSLPGPTPERRRGWMGVTLVALVASTAILFLFVRADHGASSQAISPKSGNAVGVTSSPTPPPTVAMASPTLAAEPAASALDAEAPAKRAAVLSTPAHAVAPARARVATPAADPRVAAPPPKADPPKREVDCTSPYFIDDQGLKKIRPECL